MARHHPAAIEAVRPAAPASEAERATTAVPTAPSGSPATRAVSALPPALTPPLPSLRPAQRLPPAPAIDPALAVTPPPQARAGSSEGPSFSPLLAGPGGHEVPLTRPPEAAPSSAVQEPASPVPASVPFPPRPPGLAVRDAPLAAGPAAASGEFAPHSRGRGDRSTFIQAARSAALEQVRMYRWPDRWTGRLCWNELALKNLIEGLPAKTWHQSSDSFHKLYLERAAEMV